MNDGILDLAKQGIVRRVSLLADSPFLKYRLSELLECSQVETGLHFDLSLPDRRDQENPFHFKRVVQVILNPLRPPLEKVELFEAECRRQIEKLQRAGVTVSYLDGHQHLHLLPFVSKGVAKAMSRLGIRRVRNPYSSSLWVTPKFAVNLLALFGMPSYRNQEIDSYPCLYPQPQAFQSSEALKKFLAGKDREVIVHPATRDDFTENGCTDPYREGRINEYLALKGLLEELPG